MCLLNLPPYQKAGAMGMEVEQQPCGSPPQVSLRMLRNFNVYFVFRFFPRQQHGTSLMLDNCTAALRAPSNSSKSATLHVPIALLLADSGCELLQTLDDNTVG